jgi:hypothetical protein
MSENERTAAEYLAERAADPVRVAREAQARADREERKRALRVAEAPVVADLHAVGIDVDSTWDLVNTSEPYLDALPVLFKHLKRGGYPPRIIQGISRALAVKPAVMYWDELVALYKSAVEPVGTRAADAKDGLAVILSACVNRAKVGELVELASDPSNGRTRIYFLRPVMRLGGERGRAMVASVVDDPSLGKEATALINRARRSKNAN